MDDKRRKFFENTVKPILESVGLIGAIMSAIAYLIIVFVLIKGFELHETFQVTVFAVINAVIGLIIMQFLKIQGISFAKNLPENKIIIDRYYATKTKDKKLHSITYYWITTVIKDILIKACLVASASIGVVYIVIKGSNDYNLLALAVVNLILFTCFGLLTMNSAYEFYNNEHINYLKEKLGENNNVIQQVNS